MNQAPEQAEGRAALTVEKLISILSGFPSDLVCVVASQDENLEPMLYDPELMTIDELEGKDMLDPDVAALLPSGPKANVVVLYG